MAFLIGDQNDTAMRILTVTGARTVKVPNGSQGIAAVGDRFLTAVGGPPTTAGVYSVDGDTVTRVATVPGATVPLGPVALNGSRVHFTDWSLDESPQPIRQLSITGRNRPIFGQISDFRSTPIDAGNLTGTGLSFSAGRGVVANSADFSWRLLDRGIETGVIHRSDKATVSGPYTLSNGKVYGTEADLLFTEPTVAGTRIVSDGIFGSKIVYAEQTDNKQYTHIFVDDVDRPDRKLLAVVPRAPGCTGTAHVAIWGSTVAWEACSGDGITVSDVSTRTGRRSIQASAGRTQALPFVLGEDTLAWQDGTGTNVVDLAAAALVPTVIPGTATQLQLDDHWLLRERQDAWGYAGYELQALPFKTQHPPRLIGIAAPRGFTPDATAAPTPGNRSSTSPNPYAKPNSPSPTRAPEKFCAPSPEQPRTAASATSPGTAKTRRAGPSPSAPTAGPSPAKPTTATAP